MFCSQCGKKVLDAMLFCPFCGSPIVIPDQDETANVTGTEKHAESVKEERILSGSDNGYAPANDQEQSKFSDDFVPLDIHELWASVPSDEKVPLRGESAKAVHEQRQITEESRKLQGRKPDLSASAPHGAPKIASRNRVETLVPQRKHDPADIFFDGQDQKNDEEEFEYEERERDGFFIRHIRGFVALIMFGIVAAVVIGWAFSTSGQLALARMELAWRPDIYAKVAYEAYQSGSYALAGKYYSEALERNENNYDYANSAAVSYYMAGDAVNAETMAQTAIGIDPAKKDAYEILLRLYPASEARPAQIQSLLQRGYQLTGDNSLKP